MKKIEPISASETLEIIQKTWATVEDIQKLGCMGKNKAIEIKKAIEDDLTSNGFILTTKVPMELVVKKLNININYLKKVVKE